MVFYSCFKVYDGVKSMSIPTHEMAGERAEERQRCFCTLDLNSMIWYS